LTTATTALATKVAKRDGRTVKFTNNRIKKSIRKACFDVSLGDKETKELVERVTETLTPHISQRQEISVETIEDLVVEQLEVLGAKDVAESYRVYRMQRTIEREQQTDVTHAIGKLIARDKTVINENANKDANTIPANRDLTAGVVAKAEGLKMLPKRVANAHLKGDIHFHDLTNSPYDVSTNCCLIDFKTMLSNGFKMGNAQIESPKSIQTATTVASQIIANVASQQFG
jgi:ribonucleoside-triphosphate reductase